MMIDSLNMTPGDRELIARQCQAAQEDKIVITHGTDTMADTAKVIAENVRK
jgi:L-asparaginase